MRNTLVLRASHARTPLIKFLGKRHTPKEVDHTPHAHPASPTHSLPDSFASYRSRAQQHGPMGGSKSSSAVAAPDMAAMIYGPVGARAGRSLGSIQPKEGEFFDRSELPRRFQRQTWSDAEMDAITSGGASMW